MVHEKMGYIESSIKSIVERALSEDLGNGDITTDSLILSDVNSSCKIIANSNGIVAGVDIALEAFRQLDPDLRSDISKTDGSEITRGDVLLALHGSIRAILKAERVALNFLQRLSGIATMTANYVKAVEVTKVLILDTRKTIPGLRQLEKYAVRIGGGHNHRYNLADGILIKDNHIAILRSQGLGLSEIIQRARMNAPHTLKVEIEVETVEEALEAFNARADIILLDNMSPQDMRKVAQFTTGKCLLEASGGITMKTIKQVAESGVDLISIGALTHSVQSLDISLELD